MSKQKTAMQELIDYMEANYHLTEESRYEFKKALEKEAEQIKLAFDTGCQSKIDFTADQYIVLTYSNLP